MTFEIRQVSWYNNKIGLQLWGSFTKQFYDWSIWNAPAELNIKAAFLHRIKRLQHKQSMLLVHGTAYVWHGGRVILYLCVVRIEQNATSVISI